MAADQVEDLVNQKKEVMLCYVAKLSDTLLTSLLFRRLQENNKRGMKRLGYDITMHAKR